MSVGVDMTGTDQIATAIRTKLLKSAAAVGTVTIAVVPGGRRGAEKNALIARVQAGMQRNPWYLSKDDLTAIRVLLKRLASPDAGIVDAMLKQIGAIMVDATQSHIGAMKNANGSTFSELSARYAAFKRRKFGFIHPVLRASGDLMDNLKAVITKQ